MLRCFGSCFFVRNKATSACRIGKCPEKYRNSSDKDSDISPSFRNIKKNNFLVKEGRRTFSVNIIKTIFSILEYLLLHGSASKLVRHFLLPTVPHTIKSAVENYRLRNCNNTKEDNKSDVETQDRNAYERVAPNTYRVAQKERMFFSNNCNFVYFQYKKIMSTPKQSVISAVLITYINYSISENYI